MPKRKGRAKEAKVDTPIQDLDQKETIMHYNAVLIEEQNSKFQLVLERLEAVIDKVDGLAVDVRKNGEDVRELKTSHDVSNKRLSTLEHAFRCLKDDILDMERRICSKINHIAEHCERHECRLTAIEANQ